VSSGWDERLTPCGRYLVQPGGFLAFVPGPLQPEPVVQLTDEVLKRVEIAEAALPARRTVPEAPLGDAEAVNLWRALGQGVELLADRRLGVDALVALHGTVVDGVRGMRYAGQLRRSWTWVGGRYGPTSAVYVPPPAVEARDALADLDRFLAAETLLRPSVQAALAFAQFEMIHPFRDGNGRTGRLLFNLVLHERGLFPFAVLAFERTLRQHRREYLSQLASLPRTGDWEGWIGFIARMLQGTLEQLDTQDPDHNGRYDA
jgi:Fic family protein